MDEKQQDRKLSKHQRRAKKRVFRILRDEDYEWAMIEYSLTTIPWEWKQMPEVAPVTEPKVPFSIRLDQDMVKWYRSLGRGYQARINMILRTYMLMVIARMTDESDTDVYGDPI